MKKYAAALLALILVAVMFAGCSASVGYRADENYPASDYYKNGESFYDGAADPTFAPSPDQPEGSDPFAGRKIIRNAELTVEALEFDAFMDAVLGKTAELGGYVESNNVSNSAYRKSALRTARMVLRIPAEKLDDFLLAVDGAGNIVNRSESVNDVTDSYTDIEARLASLRTEYDTLLGLLENAQGLDEIIQLQDRLTEVRYQIESYEARKRSYDSRIAYSTVSISVSEVERETAVEEESFGAEVSRRFSESLHDVGEGFKDFAAWFVGNLPTILVWLVILVGIPLVIVFSIIGSVKKKRKKKAEKADNKE